MRGAYPNADPADCYAFADTVTYAVADANAEPITDARWGRPQHTPTDAHTFRTDACTDAHAGSGHGHSDAFGYAHTDCYADQLTGTCHADSNGNADSDAITQPCARNTRLGYCYADQLADPVAESDAKSFTDTFACTDGGTAHADGDAAPNPNPCGPNTRTRDSNANRDTNGHPNSRPDGNADDDGHADTISDSRSDVYSRFNSNERR